MRIKIIATSILLGLLFVNVFNVSARTASLPEQSLALGVGADNASVTFGELGFRETSLVSPFDSTRVLFSIPANWRLSPGGEVQLDYDITLSGADASLVGTDRNPYGGALLVSFNNQAVGSIPLKELGAQTMKFELPPTALAAVRQDGRHQLTIALDAQFSCLYNIRAIVAIKPTSTFKLPFEVSSPEVNLARLPAPFHLRNALLPDRTLLVVPDEPDVMELKAALNLMAGFGSIVGEPFDFGLITAGELTEADLAASHLIFVGRPEQFELLGNVKFPLAVADKQFVNLPAESQTDGVIQMAVSPWNASKVALLVGGSSSEAVLKAAQAVSSGKVLIYQNPALAYVSSVQLLADSLPVVEDFTLQSLGYKTETMSGIGLNSVQYLFNASKEQLNAKTAYIDLMYYHSGLLDYGFSSFTIELNNQVIASAPFSEESQQLTALRLKIPPGVLRFGENRLTLSARMLASTSCDATGFSNPWLTISDQTALHLPAMVGITPENPWLMDLKSYPDLFMTHSDLGDVAFVLPKTNPSAWKIAGQLAYNLGRTANPLISNLEAVYADSVPQEVLNEDSLILVGKSSNMPLLLSFNDQLPAPFDFASNTASEGRMQVVYRIPPGMSVGYLELMASPYSDGKPILVVSGNSDDGLVMAGNALLQDEFSSQLAGVFAVTNGSQMATGSAGSPFSAVGELVPEAESVVTTPVPVSSKAPAMLPPPVWLLPVLAFSGLAILLVVVLVAVNAFSRKRESAARTFNSITQPRENLRRNSETDPDIEQ